MGFRMALLSIGGPGVPLAFWGPRGTVASKGHSDSGAYDGEPGTHYSPQLIHLILQGLRLLGQAGQCLVPLLQLSDLPF